MRRSTERNLAGNEATLSVADGRLARDARIPPSPLPTAVALGGPTRDPVADVRSRRRHLHDRVGGLLHPARGTQRGPGGTRPDHRRSRQLHRGVADGQARRPLRSQALLGGELRRPGEPLRPVAFHRQLQRLRHDGRHDAGRRFARGSRPRRLHDRRTPSGRAGDVAGLHVLRPQRRLHPGFPVGRHRPGVRLQPDPQRPAVVHHRRLHGQRRQHPPAAQRLARRAHPGGAQGEAPRAGTAAQLRAG